MKQDTGRTMCLACNWNIPSWILLHFPIVAGPLELPVCLQEGREEGERREGGGGRGEEGGRGEGRGEERGEGRKGRGGGEADERGS